MAKSMDHLCLLQGPLHVIVMLIRGMEQCHGFLEEVHLMKFLVLYNAKSLNSLDMQLPHTNRSSGKSRVATTPPPSSRDDKKNLSVISIPGRHIIDTADCLESSCIQDSVL